MTDATEKKFHSFESFRKRQRIAKMTRKPVLCSQFRQPTTMADVITNNRIQTTVTVLKVKKALKPLLCLMTPICLLPLPLIVKTDAAWCAFVTLWMAVFYVLEPVPVSVTSMIPIIIFPFLGILSSEEVAANYLNSTGLLFMASLIIATAIETSNLHNRMAYKCLLTLGTSESRVLLCLMFITVFMSMWMPNTAIASIMGPIVLVISNQMSLPCYDSENEASKRNGSVHERCPSSPGTDVSQPLQQGFSKHCQNLRKILLLSVSYASNIGGTGTIIGSSTNILFKGIVDGLFPNNIGLTNASWMLYNIPPMIICTIFGWIYLQWLLRRSRRHERVEPNYCNVLKEIKEQHEKLGGFSFSEYCVLTVLSTLVLALFFYRPQFMVGWGDFIDHGRKIKSATPALAICFVLFLLPKDPKNLKSTEPILTWKCFASKMPWGILILFGGCLSLAEASKRSGLSDIIVNSLKTLQHFPPSLILVLLCFITCGLTEIVSTYVITGILTAIVGEMAVALKVNPLYFLMPVKASGLFAFMLPIATGANAIIFEMGRMKTVEMVRIGAPMNIACVLIQIAAIHTIGLLVFDLNNFPAWAVSSHVASSSITHLNTTHVPQLNVTQLPLFNLTASDV